MYLSHAIHTLMVQNRPATSCRRQILTIGANAPLRVSVKQKYVFSLFLEVVSDYVCRPQITWQTIPDDGNVNSETSRRLWNALSWRVLVDRRSASDDVEVPND